MKNARTIAKIDRIEFPVPITVPGPDRSVRGKDLTYAEKPDRSRRQVDKLDLVVCHGVPLVHARLGDHELFYGFPPAAAMSLRVEPKEKRSNA